MIRDFSNGHYSFVRLKGQAGIDVKNKGERFDLGWSADLSRGRSVGYSIYDRMK
jgi:hypothetical protein